MLTVLYYMIVLHFGMEAYLVIDEHCDFSIQVAAQIRDVTIWDLVGPSG